MHSALLRGKTFAALALVVSFLAIPTAAQTPAADARSTPVVVKTQIDNFGQVNANYYRGAQPAGRDYQDLAALGVKTLINLTSDDAEADEQMQAERVGMKYFQIPMTTRRAPSTAQIEEFLKIASDPANQPVYVHCVGGRHRTGVMTAVYRITVDNWTSDRAFAEMKQYKFGADFLHPEFKTFVYGYHAPATAVAAPAAATVKQ